MKKVGLALGAVFLVVLAICLGMALVGSPDKQTGFAEDEGTAHVTSAPVSQTADTIRPGTWEVGKDVKPGKYKTTGATNPEIPLCYWHVMEDGQIMAQGVKDQVGAQGIVTLTKGDLFETNGCEPWYASE